jgi:hypothetical protein
MTNIIIQNNREDKIKKAQKLLKDIYDLEANKQIKTQKYDLKN